MIGRNNLIMRWPAALAFFIVASIMATVPVFLNHFVSLNDVYNHVARIPVLAHYHDVAAYREYWAPNWRLVPYLGFDLVALALFPWFSLGLIVKLMVVATLLSMLAGAMLLSRTAYGRWSAASLLPVLFLLNRTLLAGFINYLFGIGVALIGAAAWIGLRDRHPALRIATLAGFAVLLCAIHLFACAVLGLVVFGIELAAVFGGFAERRPPAPRVLAALAAPVIAFIPAALIAVFVAPHPGFHVVYASLGTRIAAFAVPLTYAPGAEAAGLLLVGLVLAALWAAGCVSIDRRLATAAALLALVQMAMPSELGTATVVDHRIPIAFWMVAACAVDVRLSTPALARGFVLVLGLVFLSRVGIIQHRWMQENVVYAQTDKALAALPGDARVATAYPLTGLNKATRPDVAMYYMPALEYVPRGGFTQILWTIPDQHPLVMRPQFRELAAVTSADTLWDNFVEAKTPAPNVEAAIKDYDYVVFLDAEPFEVRPNRELEPVRLEASIKIYRVRHGEADQAAPRPG